MALSKNLKNFDTKRLQFYAVITGFLSTLVSLATLLVQVYR